MSYVFVVLIYKVLIFQRKKNICQVTVLRPLYFAYYVICLVCLFGKNIVEKGDQLGAVNVMLHNKIVSSKPLIALNAVAIGSYFQRAYDSALMLIKSNNGK